MATKTPRTAPFEKIRETPLSSVNPHTGRTITHTVQIPGLKHNNGEPYTVDTTFTLDEIDNTWVSGIRDYEFGDAPAAYGDHPAAVGPLRDLLPDAYPLPEFPADRREAQRKLVRMLAQHDLGGNVFLLTDSVQVCVTPPRWAQISGLESEEMRQARWFAAVREYLPFQADIWYDDAADVVRVRPCREKVTRVVRTA